MEIDTAATNSSHKLPPEDARELKVYSIPPGCNFLQVFVNSLLDGEIIPGFAPRGDSLALSQATIFVPNRRTARALGLAFLSSSDGPAQILPRIKTLGDAEDEPLGLAGEADELTHDLSEVGSLERTLELSLLVQRWIEALSSETRRLYDDEDIFIPSSQADAIRLAGDLSKLLDQIIQEEIDWKSIDKIVPEEHAEWWGITNAFLRIILQHWPGILAEQGLIDPVMLARNRIERRIESYRKNGSPGPVIIAGSTGSVPATRRLLKVISQLPNGAIVLPGLDTDLPGIEWQALQQNPLEADDTLESHPQYGLANLLSEIGLDRQFVKELAQATVALKTRARTVSTALSLPGFTDTWVKSRTSIEENTLSYAFENVALVEANNARQEAIAIAIALRETLEVSGKTAALVTPDRNLAQRVGIELQRFGIKVDDTAGRPLKSSPSALFIRQIIRYCLETGSKAELVSLLKSPLFRVGRTHSQARALGEAIEIAGLRGSINTPRCGQLQNFLDIRFNALCETNRTPVWLSDIERSQELLTYAGEIDRILAPIQELSANEDTPSLAAFINCLSAIIAQLTQNPEGETSLEGLSGISEINALFEDILHSGAADYPVNPRDFPSVFDALLEPLTAQNRDPTHPRLHIYGALEIRLLDHDRVIIAGLNEGTWPQATRNDSFLNRTMRLQLSMDSPERKIGLAGHDFQQLMGARDVILTRSLRVDKAPTIASRWLQRLSAFLGKELISELHGRGETYLRYATQLDKSDAVRGRSSRPNPTPPIEVRPTRLPVTDIETWIRDPYALYAKRILKLRPLDPIERAPDALLRGTLYHAIFEEYVTADIFNLPVERRLQKLLETINRHIEAEKLEPEFALVWKIHAEEIARQFVIWEEEQPEFGIVKSVHKEIDGKMELANGNFLLHARADRVDVLGDKRIMVLDYKTGLSPSPKQARTLSPQMALEGAIAKAGGFKGIKAAEIAELGFIRLVPGERFGLQKIADRNSSIEDIIAQAAQNLTELVLKFQKRETGYLSRRTPFRESEMSADYDHLARTREWSFGEEGDE